MASIVLASVTVWFMAHFSPSETTDYNQLYMCTIYIIQASIAQGKSGRLREEQPTFLSAAIRAHITVTIVFVRLTKWLIAVVLWLSFVL